MHEFDDAVGGVRNASNEIACARTLPRTVGGRPVGARAEVVPRAADVDDAQRIIGGGFGQQIDTYNDAWSRMTKATNDMAKSLPRAGTAGGGR